MSQPHPILLDILCYLREHREISNILRGPYGDIMFQIRSRKILQQSLFPEELMKTFYPRDTELHISYMMGGQMEVIQDWIHHDGLIPAEELAVQLYRLMFSNLFLGNA